MTRAGFVDVWKAALGQLAKAENPALILLVGEEAHVKERLIAAAAESRPGEIETFSQRPSEADPRALDRLVDDWGTRTLFGGGRLIVARAVDALLKGNGPARLEAVLDGGSPPNQLLLTLSAFDGRTRLAKRVKEAGGLVSLPPLRDSAPPWHTGGPFLETDLNAWLVAEAQLQGLRLPLPVADALTRKVGNEPGRLAQTLQRLSVLIGERQTLEAGDVSQHVQDTTARLLARYEDALRAGQIQEALVLVDRMSKDGVYDPFMKLVTGPLVGETVLRGLTSALAREIEAHDLLGSDGVAALSSPPWKRSKTLAASLDEALGKGGRRVFLERDLRRTSGPAARAAFGLAVRALRDLRDGAGGSLHATTVRLARALSSADTA